MVAGRGRLIGGSPLRPDGKGLLLMRGREMIWLDNAGVEKRFPIHRDVLADSAKAEILTTPWRGSSYWKGSTGVISYGRFRVEIDTDKYVMNCTAIPDGEAVADGKLIEQLHRFGPGAATVRVVNEDSPAKQPPRLELLIPGTPPAELITTSDGFLLCPSPDGKWLLARDMTDSSEHDDMVLIDRKGTVVRITGKGD